MAVSAEQRARDAGVPVIDFDIELDPQFRDDPETRWRQAFDAGPIFYSSAARGFWVVTRYDLVREIVHHPERFSSREIYLFYREPLDFFDIPTQLDPPRHMPVRRLLSPLLSPAAVQEIAPDIRAITRTLIDEIVARGECEFNSAFALRLPALVIMQQLGLPLERERELVDLVLEVAHPDSARDPGLKRQRQAAKAIDAMWLEVVREKRANPGEDWTSALVQAEVDGEPLDDDMSLALMGTLLRGGFDTTAGTLGYAFHYLARHPELRARITDDPDLVPVAVEEFLRWYGGVPLITRVAATDLDFHGVRLEEGDRLTLLLRSANHDPVAFDEPLAFDADRSPNKHLAFGLGQHRCAGMHLARAELAISLEEWHRRIPDYRLGDMTNAKHEVSQNIRLSELPLVLERDRAEAPVAR
jgi:cytochrome P450